MKFDAKVYEKYSGIAKLVVAARLLVELRQMVEADSPPNTDFDHCLKLLNDQPMLHWELRQHFWQMTLPNLEATRMPFTLLPHGG